MSRTQGKDVAMMRLIVWIATLYVVLKATQWATTPRGAYAEHAADWRSDLRRGEPWLLIGTILLPTLVFTYGQWWNQRWSARSFAHATDCIGQLGSLERLPNVYARFSRSTISDSANSYYSLALDQGARLHLRRDQIDAIMSRRRQAYSGRYARLVRSSDRRRIDHQFASIDRCLKDEWSHDGLFNP